ncbi:DUF3717 domain-containing protein [Undibacterium sp. Jales W-56]|uniref:DUF3717 domain-containing protein n=1 Tax=Undibacterium sp. Jales W-56 TaxID=2897325 RepID=UPI0021D336EE|nr:DUF3717 domain-containing protein [Undibacterium sp. Jales W-56]MCU6434656.1 DUF3717 domain-containing protein [Undibacterium sp. Jales W-56]
MKNDYTINEIEQAINAWRYYGLIDGLALGQEARALANVYGLMIYQKKKSVSSSELTSFQIKVLNSRPQA